MQGDCSRKGGADARAEGRGGQAASGGRVVVSRAVRDVLWVEAMSELSGVGDVQVAIHNREYADAERLSCHYREVARLLDDVGWAEVDERAEVVLSIELDVLVRVVRMLERDARETLETLAAEHAEETQASEAGIEAHAKVLAQLAPGAWQAGEGEWWR